jgi:hypothetical protein
MNWSRAHTLGAGLGLIALTNAVALVGVAYNRGGEPEAALRLTQRELRTPYEWRGNRENSGLALSLVWRVPQEQTAGRQFYPAFAGGRPLWLDQAKMAELGFDTTLPARFWDPRGRSRFERQLSREVLLVLELDGAAYRRSLELTAQHLASEEAALAANPGERTLAARAKNARDALERETSRNSRLFVADAGLDAAALRAKYPDRTRYAIVRGQVRPELFERENYSGYIAGLSVESINVPFALREIFAGAEKAGELDQPNLAPFEAVVAFGGRFEPWILEAAKK